jgi:hypothetical protein
MHAIEEQEADRFRGRFVSMPSTRADLFRSKMPVAMKMPAATHRSLLPQVDSPDFENAE